MGTSNIIKMDNRYWYGYKAFQQFSPNGISNIRNAFLIILKEKELWSVPRAS